MSYPTLEILSLLPICQEEFNYEKSRCIEPHHWVTFIPSGDDWGKPFLQVTSSGYTPTEDLIFAYKHYMQDRVDLESIPDVGGRRLALRAIIDPFTKKQITGSFFAMVIRVGFVEGTLYMTSANAGILLESLSLMDQIPYNINWVYKQMFDRNGLYRGPADLGRGTLILISNPFTHDLSSLSSLGSLIIGDYATFKGPEALQCKEVTIRSAGCEALPMLTGPCSTIRVGSAPLHILPPPSNFKDDGKDVRVVIDSVSGDECSRKYPDYYKVVSEITRMHLGELMTEIMHPWAGVRAFVQGRTQGTLAMYEEWNV
jgi:hypothetical protein